MKQAVLFWNITRVWGCHCNFAKFYSNSESPLKNSQLGRWRYAPAMAIGAFSKRGFWSSDTCGSSIFCGGFRFRPSVCVVKHQNSWNIQTVDLFLKMLEICSLKIGEVKVQHHPNKKNPRLHISRGFPGKPRNNNGLDLC